jgi:hypothetical protein
MPIAIDFIEVTPTSIGSADPASSAQSCMEGEIMFQLVSKQRSGFSVLVLALIALALSIALPGVASAQLSGTLNIPGDYPTLADAVTALNTQGVATGGVVLNVLAGNPETAPAGGYVIGGAGSLVLTTTGSGSTVTIQGNGNTITASAALTAGALNDAIFKLIGADWVTITGFVMQENPANTTITPASNNMTEWGVALLHVSTTDGAQNNTIQGNTISLNRTYTNTWGVYANNRHSATAVTTPEDVVNATTGPNNYNKVYGNTISNVNMGIAFIGTGTAAYQDVGNDVGGSSAGTGNTVTNWGGAAAASSYVSNSGTSYCIFMNHQTSDNTSYNTITSAAVSGTSVTFRGIFKDYTATAPTGTFTSNITNNTVTMTSGFTSGTFEGIRSQGMTTLATAAININYNTILNCAVTGTSSSTTIVGIVNSSVPGALNMNNNVVRGTTSTATSGGFTGVYNTGAVVNTINLNNNQIGNASGGAITFSAATSGAVYGVYNTGGASTAALSMQTNDVRGIVHSVAGSSTHYYVYNTATALSQNLSYNTFTNLNVNTTGSVYFLYCSDTGPTNCVKTASNNSVVTAFNKAGAGGSVYLFYDFGSSGATVVHSNNNNNFSNLTFTGATTVYGWYNADGVSPSPTKTIQNNTFSNWVGGTSAVTGMTLNYATTAGVSGNTVTGITGAGAITGISLGSSFTTVNTYQNTVGGLASTGAAAVQGITTASTTANIYKNKIYDLSGNNASTTVNGILISAGTTITVTNNLIGDLRATAATSTSDVVRGISMTSTTSSSAINLYDNTIYLNATSSGTNFSTSGIYHTASSTATTAALNLRGNIIVNKSTPNGTGYAVAYRRSGTALNNYASTSNNNLLYAGAPGTYRLIFYDGTNSDQTLAAFQTRVAPRDANSVTENPTFLSTTGTNPSFLHIDPAVPTQIEGGGQAIAGVTDDFDGDVRNATTPDIGADEGPFPYADLTPPVIALTPLGNTAVTGDRTLTATITDNASGVPTSGIGLPVLYWKINAGAYSAATAASMGGSSYQFTFGAGAVPGDVVSYYVCAQDGAASPNVACSPSAGASGLTANPPAAAVPPTTPWSYSIMQGISGTFTVGTSRGDYSTLTAAVADLNAKVLTGPVTFLLIDAAYPSETFPIVIAANGGSSATNTLTIKPNTGVTATIAGSLASGTLIKLNGADYVTIDGSNSGGSDKSLTITNSATTAPCVIWIASQGLGQGATNNTIKNCNLNASAATTATAYGIAVAGSTLGSGGADNDNVIVLNNAIATSNIGVYAFGTTGTSAGGLDNLTVSGNSVTSSTTLSPLYGVEVAYALNALVEKNTVNLTTSASTAPVGISIETSVSNSTVSSNRIVAVVTTATGGYGGRGITVGTTTTGSNITVVNNFVAGVNGSNYSSFGNSSSIGIAVGIIGNSSSLTTTTGGVKLYHNTVNMAGSYTYSTAGCLTAGVYVGSGASALDIRNNIFENSLTNTSTAYTSKSYSIYSAVANTAYSPISYNNYYVGGTQGVLGYLGADLTTLAALNTAFTGNANTPGYNLNAAFTSATDLHIPASTLTALESGGTNALSVAVDIDNETRPGPPGSINGGGTAPDVGADEFDGTPLWAKDIAATSFVDPTNGGTKSTGIAFAPQASFTNLGTADQTNITVRYRIVGPAPGTDEVYNQTAVIASLAAFGSTTATFPPATLTAGGTYTIYAASELAGDQVPANDQITGSFTALQPLAGTYYVGTGLYKEASGLNLTFERHIQTVRKEVLEPVEISPNAGDEEKAAFASMPEALKWKSVEREVEEVTYVPLVDGKPYEKSLRVSKLENPNLPDGFRDGVYATITAAVADLNLRGAGGPVTFLLTDATYTTETFPIVVDVTSAPPTADRPVTLRPNTGVTSTISGSLASGALIKLNGVSYVTIDGSNSGGSDRSLTITNTATTAPAVIWIASKGLGLGATHDTIKNCNLNASAATTATAYGIAVAGSTLASQGADNDSTTLQNNAINCSNVGIYAFGTTATSAGGLDNLTVAGNSLSSSSTFSTVYGVEVGYALNALVSNNTVNLTTSSGAQPVGISIETSVSNSTVSSNHVESVVTTSTGGYGGRGITVGTGATGSNITIVNNFVAGVNGSNYSSFGLSSSIGIAVGIIGNSSTLTTTTGGVNIYHNSVNMAGTYSYSTNCITAAIYVGSGASSLDIRNNIINNTLSNTNASGLSSKNYTIYSVAANTAYTGFGYNDYYVSGTQGVLGYLGGDLTTLAALNTAFTGNASTPGFTVSPAFTTAINLHFPVGVSTLLESAGTGSLPVSVDIDNEARPGPPGSIHGGGTAPDVGADEFDGTPLVQNDMAATAFVDPTNGGTKSVGTPFTPVATFTNLGTLDQTNVTVRYRIVGPAPGTDEVYNQTQVIASLASTVSTNVTFPAVTLTSGGSYAIYAKAELAGDQQAANDEITGTMAVLEPLAGTYYVGVGTFKQVTGLDLTFERHVQTVRQQVNEPVDPLSTTPKAERGNVTPPDHMIWKSVEREVEEVSYVPLVNGQAYEKPLRTSRVENPSLPGGLRDGVYATLTAAVADLNSRGVGGPVTFLLTDATYPSETFPIVVNVTSAAPTAERPVVFKPNTGVTSTVAGASANSAVFKIVNTNYVTIDGSNAVDGTTRDLTIENTSATTPEAVWIGSVGTTPITHITLKNCVVRNGVNTSSAVVISDGTTAGNAGYFSDITIRNNKIEKAYNGVYANGGTTTATGSNLTLVGNELNTTDGPAIRKTGLYAQGVTGVLIEKNDIGNFERATGENDTGIWLASGVSNAIVNANRVHDINYSGTSGYGPKGIAISTGMTPANITVTNNMVSNITGDGDSYSSYGCTYNPVGIYEFGTTTAQTSVVIADNSVYLYGNTLNYASGVYSIGIGLDDSNIASVIGNNVVNNLGRLSTIGTGAAALALETAASQLTSSNHNNLYCNSTGGGTNLVGKIASTDYATMAAWRTASGQDAQSISADPLYVSTTNLHIRQDVVSPVSNAGTVVAAVTNDYDGDARDPSNPDIGADEFTVFVLTTHVVGNGAIQINPAQAVYAPGTQVTLTAVPVDVCTFFQDWSGDANGNTNPLAVTMNANKDITATFVPVAHPLVTVVHPNGGDSLYVGATYHITWTASGGTPLTVDLAYSENSGLTYPHTIVTGIANTGEYDWVVPSTPTIHGRLRVTVHDECAQTAVDASDADFKILTNVDAVAENLLAPGEILGVYPNPAEPGNANVLYRLPAGTASVEIYDVAGRLVRRLTSGNFAGGVQSLTWDGRGTHGEPVASGIYLVRLQSSSGKNAVKRLVLVHQ